MREQSPAPEQTCEACNGTGFAPDERSSDPMKRVFPARCAKCDGRGKPIRAIKKFLGLQIGERWQEPELAAIDAWIEATGKPISRGEAIRRLVKIGLKAKVK
jgi:hypothetical protein